MAVSCGGFLQPLDLLALFIFEADNSGVGAFVAAMKMFSVRDCYQYRSIREEICLNCCFCSYFVDAFSQKFSDLSLWSKGHLSGRIEHGSHHRSLLRLCTSFSMLQSIRERKICV